MVATTDSRHGELGLLNRHGEQAAIDRALRVIRDGFSAALVIRGGPGVGKTSLLAYAADSAPDMRICDVVGVESEVDLEFAALHQLLIPFQAEGAAATGPDETVATELEHAAERAQARGGYASRAALLRRSVDLSVDEVNRTRRRVELADAELRSGHPNTAQHLVDWAMPQLASPRARASGERLRQWLRRAKRRRDTRRELRDAYAMYEGMGAQQFANLAAEELRATGERARARTHATSLDLTPQEARVAGLAAEGVTNNQIAAQLFISPRTVEYHLGKVFRKLGVSSRAQMARRLPASHEVISQ